MPVTRAIAEQSLQQIAETTARLFDGQSVRIRIAENGEWVRTIAVGASAERVGAEVSPAQGRIGGNNLPSTVVLENRQIHIPDLDHLDPAMAHWPGLPHARAAGARTMAGIPLRRDGRAIGVLMIYRYRLSPFTTDELALLQSFADQAAIAIENARLFNETREALARQTATSEILRVISGSPTDVQPVFDAIVLTAARLLRCDRSFIQRCDKDGFWTVASAGPQGPVPITQSSKAPIDPDANFPSRAIVAKKTLHLADWSVIELPEFERNIRKIHGTNSALYMPLLRGGECIGLLAIIGQQANMFGESEIALAESFRDQALIAIENTRLFNETREALERQTATADILKVIASSPSDVQPVFEAIAERSNRLIDGLSTAVHRIIDDVLHLAAFTRTTPAGDAALQASFPRPLSSATWGENIRNGETVDIPDTEIEWAGQPGLLEMARLRGFRSLLFVPLLRNGATIGIISVSRKEAGRFAPHHVLLLQTFADQAVIAIENARLFNETREALERQTATADILKVIASSPSDVQPVFEAIAERSKRLVDALSTTVFRLENGVMHLRAFTITNPEADATLKAMFPAPLSNFSWGEAISNGNIHRVVDTEQEIEDMRELARLRGYRSMLFVPLLRDGAPIGLIAVTRVEPGPFVEHHVQLLQTFADQAVIAIENVRLFDEVQARTNDLQESLEYQTATSDVLQVISRSTFDLQPVLDTLVESAYKLCSARLGLLYLRGDDAFECKATAGAGTEEVNRLFKGRPIRAGRGTAAERVIMTGEVQSVTDFFDDPEVDPKVREMIRDAGNSGSGVSDIRSTLAVPMTRDDTVIGVIVIARAQTGPFPQRQIELLQTFADQAVIAIENVRLFDEVQAKTRDLTESLQQQTATADVLKVISRSAFDLQTVLDTLVELAARLCEADMAAITRQKDNKYFRAGSYGLAPEFVDYVKDIPVKPERATITGRTLLEGKVIHVPDVHADPDYTFSEAQELSGDPRTFLGVPLLREGKPVGALVLLRRTMRPFTDKQIELVTTFADQAVIAIENVRLFDEVQARTRDLTESLQQQTATADVLKVISRSTFDLKTVLDTLIGSAAQLCDANAGHIYLREGEIYKLAACAGFSAEYEEFMKQRALGPGRGSLIGRTAEEGSIVIIPDAVTDPEYEFRDAQRLGKFRTMLGIPMLRDGAPIGVLGLTRSEVRAFTDKQIELVTTFADQAVIAIENVRLFEQVQAKTADLTESLQFQTATSEVLKVISRSPDTLQPVLDVIIETSRELCGCDASTIFLLREGLFHVTAVSGSLPAHLDHLKANPLPIGTAGSVLARVYHQKRTLHYPNVMDDPELSQGSTGLGGARALLTVPLISDGQVIGAITLRQSVTRPFTPRQIQAIETFADQAVIAISNVNLFEQVQQRTRELSASLDELRTAQDRLVQTEKLASLGQLTAGIAHEIKNPLNFVNNFSALSAELTDELNDVLKQATLSETIREEVDELTKMLKDNLEKVVQHGKRADSIVKNMLLHSREGSGEHRPADINALLDESLNLAYHGARAEKPQFNVTLQRDFDATAGTIEVFPQEITRVFLNLISNGFYAVTKRKADNGGSDFEPAVTAATRNLGGSVEIRIRDNGTGIPDEVKEKMFNPFFTTKPAGEGTGLGLSMSHDIIVKQHGGTIDVDTEPGQFTEFRIVLPRTSHLQKRGQS